MSMNSIAIAVGAEARLHKAVRAAILKQFETKLLAAADSARAGTLTRVRVLLRVRRGRYRRHG